MIAILDYGMGNLRSVEKALAKVGAATARTDDHDAIRAADGLVLPGVGAFPEAMSRMDERGLSDLVSEEAAAGKPVLGICLGMQLLFDSTSELGGAEGLGLLPGDVHVLETRGLKAPHIGWAPVRWEADSPLTRDIPSEEPFYLVHSFAPRPAVERDVLGTAEYGERFVCAVQRDNVFGFQFHPEKSSGAGLRLLENFASICAPVPA